MTRYVFEKLPPHWLFVPSKRQIKELLAGIGADVRLVEMYGTGSSRSLDRVSLGYVESRVVQAGWCFYLRIWGVKEAIVGSTRDEIAAAALQSIGEYIRECVKRPPADVTKPTQMLLVFRMGAEGVRTCCHTKVVGRYSFRSPTWWEIELADQSADKPAG